MTHRPRLGIQIAASLAILAATFAPWAASGERTFHAYDAATIADRLDLTSVSWLRPIALVPLALAVALLARWFDRHLLAASLAAVAGLFTLAAAVGTWLALAPEHRAGGPIGAAVAGLALLAAGAAEVGSHRGASRRSGSTHRRP